MEKEEVKSYIWIFLSAIAVLFLVIAGINLFKGNTVGKAYGGAETLTQEEADTINSYLQKLIEIDTCPYCFALCRSVSTSTTHAEAISIVEEAIESASCVDCPLQPECSINLNQCNYGIFRDITDTPTQQKWECYVPGLPLDCHSDSEIVISCNICIPETNQVFCSRYYRNCGSYTGLDNCGLSRTVNCGACNLPSTCQNGNCICSPQCSGKCPGASNGCGGTCSAPCPSGTYCDQNTQRCCGGSSACGACLTCNCGTYSSPTRMGNQWRWYCQVGSYTAAVCYATSPPCGV